MHGVRWETLFQDLQSQYDAAAREEQDHQVAELTEAEVGTVRLSDRIRARTGSDLRVRLRSGDGLHGRVLDAAPQWFLLAEGDRRTVVPADAVAMAWPLGRAAPEAGVAESRLRITHVLRGLARSEVLVQVSSDAGRYTGWLERVGADHVDLRPQRPSVRGEELVSLTLTSLLSVSHP